MAPPSSTPNVTKEVQVLEISLEGIEHPTNGKLSGCFELQFVLPIGTYVYPTIIEDKEKLRKTVMGMVSVCRQLWPNDDDEYIYKRLHDFTHFTAFANPERELDDPRMLAFTYQTAWAFALDDFEDTNYNSDESEGAALVSYRAFLEFREKWRSWDPAAIEGIPSATSELENVKEFMTHFMHHVNSCIPNFAEKALLGSEPESALTFTSTILQAEMKQKKVDYSPRTNFEISRYRAGSRPMLEFLAICYDIHLTADIRSDVLFKTLMNIYTDISTYMNAIFGLPRDIKQGNVDGPIMYLVMIKNWSLQRAVDKVQRDLLDAYHDYRLTTEKLLEVYGESDDNVRQFIERIGYTLDGSLHAYKIAVRYGMQDKSKIRTKQLE